MASTGDLPETIPVFPLSGVVLFPRCELALNIFEPRYVAMVKDIIDGKEGLIGMIQPRSEDGSERDLYSVGCAGRIANCRKTEDGRFEISLQGVSRFRLQELVPGAAPYLQADVDWSDFGPDCGSEEEPAGDERSRFQDVLQRFAEAQGFKLDWSRVEKERFCDLVNWMTMFVGLAPEEKQALLEIPDAVERSRALELLITIAAQGGKEMTAQ